MELRFSAANSRRWPGASVSADRRQRDDVGDRRAFVDRMHGLADQAEFEHRAIILDEARVRGAAGGRELRLAAGHLGDGGGGKIGERSGLGDEDVGVRRLPVEGIMDAARGGSLRAAFDQRLERGLAVVVVVADVEARARLAGNEIDGRIADIDRGEFEMRRMRIARCLGRAAPAALRSASPGRGSDCRRDRDRRRGPGGRSRSACR